MNERIRELAIQTCDQIEWDGPNTPIESFTFTPQMMQKFAELIVTECIGCCEQVISDPVPESVDTWLNGGEHCIQEITEHFGLGMSVEDKKQLIKDLLGVNNDTKS